MRPDIHKIYLSQRSACALLLAAVLSVGAMDIGAATRPRATASQVRAVSATPARTTPVRQLTITVLWDDAMSTRESGLWIGYLFARMEFVSRNGGRYMRAPGVVTPIFDEEVFARGEAAKIYRELRSQGKGTDSAYFNDLDKVDAAGFMREYVWQYLHRDGWDAPSEALRTREFERWARDNLAGHMTQTRGRIAFQTGTAAGS